MPIVHTTDPRCIPVDRDGFTTQWWYAVWEELLPRSVLPQLGDWTSTDDLPADLALLLGFPHADDPVW